MKWSDHLYPTMYPLLSMYSFPQSIYLPFQKRKPQAWPSCPGRISSIYRSQYLCQQPDLSMSSPEFRDKPLYIHKLCTTPCLHICVKRKLIISVKKYLVNVEFLILFNLSHMIFHSSDYCIQNHHYKIGKNNTGSRRSCRHIRKGHTRNQTHHWDHCCVYYNTFKCPAHSHWCQCRENDQARDQ